MSKADVPLIGLANGVKIPQIGYGVFKIPPEETEACVRTAIEVGYRHIDTAQNYRNEAGVGAAVASCGVPREELFLTTKVMFQNLTEDRAYASILESLEKLRTDYVDLLLVHQPFGDYYGFWRAVLRAYEEKRVRAVGVSNFYPDRFTDLAIFGGTVPMVDQMEMHVFYQQKKSMETLKKYGAVMEAWAPLAQAKNGIYENPVLLDCAAAHGKTVAQVALRFLVQQGVVVLPKSTHEERMRENLEIFDFALTEEEMERIGTLDRNCSLNFSHSDPEAIDGFTHRLLGR